MMNEQKGNEEELKVNITLPSLVQPQICPWLVEHYLSSYFIPPASPPPRTGYSFNPISDGGWGHIDPTDL